MGELNFCKNCPALNGIDSENLRVKERVLGGVQHNLPGVIFGGITFTDDSGRTSDFVTTVVKESNTMTGSDLQKGVEKLVDDLDSCEGPSLVARFLGRYGVGKCGTIDDLNTKTGELYGN